MEKFYVDLIKQRFNYIINFKNLIKIYFCQEEQLRLTFSSVLNLNKLNSIQKKWYSGTQ